MPSRRVAVRHPRTEAARRTRNDRPALREISEDSAAGQVLIASLVRAQLLLAFAVVALFTICFGGLGLVLAATHGFRGRALFGIPLTWVVLGPPSYLVIVLLGVLFRRRADRNEQDFMDLVEGT